MTETGVQAFALTLKEFAKVAREANTVAKTMFMVASIGCVVEAGGKVVRKIPIENGGQGRGILFCESVHSAVSRQILAIY